MTQPANAPVTLNESYRLCARIARTRARNFYFAFLPLPHERRRAMCAVYAFMRYCDDLADDHSVQDRAGSLKRWREALHRVVAGDTGSHPMMPAFHDTLKRYSIPISYFDEVISGAEMDLTVNRYETFDELYHYCYRVASAVGLTCLKVFGYNGEGSLKLGEWCGIAFQLTNILRDIREDYTEGRIYIPQEDLRRFGLAETELGAHSLTPRLKPLLEFQARRAREYYEKALPLLEQVDPESQGCLSAMICIYHGLLREIRRRNFEVFRERVSLPATEKLGLAVRCWISPRGALRREVAEGWRPPDPAR